MIIHFCCKVDASNITENNITTKIADGSISPHDRHHYEMALISIQKRGIKGEGNSFSISLYTNYFHPYSKKIICTQFGEKPTKQEIFTRQNFGTTHFKK